MSDYFEGKNIFKFVGQCRTLAYVLTKKDIFLQLLGEFIFKMMNERQVGLFVEG